MLLKEKYKRIELVKTNSDYQQQSLIPVCKLYDVSHICIIKHAVNLTNKWQCHCSNTLD